MDAAHLSLIPMVSEKAVASASAGIYVFKVPLSANKQQVLAAVAQQFSVKPIDARFVVAKGKPKRSPRGKRAYPATIHRSDVKKAYVQLSEGESLKIYDEATEETK